VDYWGERPAAAKRARWLAELAAAVDEAQRVAYALSLSRGSCAEAEILFGRLDAVRIEVQDLRGAGRSARPARINPRWTSLFPGARGPGL
jgi:hypothetical protein